MTLSSRVPSMGWTSNSAAASVLLTLALQREKAGERITALLEQKEWTHEDLAHASGVSVKTVSRIANGKNDARKHTRDALAAALDTTAGEIWDKPAPLGLGVEDPTKLQLDRIEEKLDRLLAMAEPKTPAKTRAKGVARSAAQRSQRRKPGSPAGRPARSKEAPA